MFSSLYSVTLETQNQIVSEAMSACREMLFYHKYTISDLLDLRCSDLHELDKILMMK